MEQEFHGIMPNYFEATLSEFSDEFNDYEGWDWYFYGVSFRSSLSLGEQLNTPRGSIGAIMMAYAWQKHRTRIIRTQQQIDNLEAGVGVSALTFYSDMEQKVQYLCPVSMLQNFIGFKILLLEGIRFQKMLMLGSLLLRSKFSRLRMDDVPIIRLLIFFKEPFNHQLIKFMKDKITRSLEKMGLKDNYEI